MIASVLAIASVAILLGGGILSLAWALVKRADTIGELRERLAAEQGKRKAEEVESDGLSRHLETEIERTETLAAALARRGDIHVTPAAAIETLGGMLSGWRERAAAAKNRLHANRELRDASTTISERRNAVDGREETGAMPASEPGGKLPDTSPGTPSAIARKNPKP